VELLSLSRYILYFDNLFVSRKLLLLLRERGYGIIGTYRTDSGIFKEEAKPYKSHSDIVAMP
jgi:hypothetical protein